MVDRHNASCVLSAPNGNTGNVESHVYYVFLYFPHEL